MALVGLLSTGSFDKGIALQQGAILPRNRWCLAKLALEKGASHLFFLDSDIVCPEDTIQRLLEHGKPLIGAPYHTRSLTHPESTVSLMGPEGREHQATLIPDVLFEAYGLPLGCTLIATEVFRAVPQPWFAYAYNKEGEVATGEDTWFCERARGAGFPSWCDPTIPVGHVGDYVY